MKLNDSKVKFDPVLHRYELDGAVMKGVTKVIDTRLFPDEYKDVPDFVLQRAAQRGKRIHTAVEFYDDTRLYTDDCPELQSYIRQQEAHQFLTNSVCSEYLVTDGKTYASAIDKIYEDGAGGVILADIKTNYKLSEERVSWQLSIYKYFFELLNPGIPVTGLYAIWLRDDKSKVCEVQVRSVEDVCKLLYTDEPMNVEAEATSDFDEAELKRLKDEAEAAQARYEECKQRIYDKMVASQSTKVEGTLFVITRRLQSERVTIDTKALKEDLPDVYGQYARVTTSKGGITIRER